MLSETQWMDDELIDPETGEVLETAVFVEPEQLQPERTPAMAQEEVMQLPPMYSQTRYERRGDELVTNWQATEDEPLRELSFVNATQPESRSELAAKLTEALAALDAGAAGVIEMRDPYQDRDNELAVQVTEFEQLETGEVIGHSYLDYRPKEEQPLPEPAIDEVTSDQFETYGGTRISDVETTTLLSEDTAPVPAQTVEPSEPSADVSETRPVVEQSAPLPVQNEEIEVSEDHRESIETVPAILQIPPPELSEPIVEPDQRTEDAERSAAVSVEDHLAPTTELILQSERPPIEHVVPPVETTLVPALQSMPQPTAGTERLAIDRATNELRGNDGPLEGSTVESSVAVRAADEQPGVLPDPEPAVAVGKPIEIHLEEDQLVEINVVDQPTGEVVVSVNRREQLAKAEQGEARPVAVVIETVDPPTNPTVSPPRPPDAPPSESGPAPQIGRPAAERRTVSQDRPAPSTQPVEVQKATSEEETTTSFKRDLAVAQSSVEQAIVAPTEQLTAKSQERPAEASRITLEGELAAQVQEATSIDQEKPRSEVTRETLKNELSAQPPTEQSRVRTVATDRTDQKEQPVVVKTDQALDQPPAAAASSPEKSRSTDQIRIETTTTQAQPRVDTIAETHEQASQTADRLADRQLKARRESVTNADVTTEPVESVATAMIESEDLEDEANEQPVLEETYTVERTSHQVRPVSRAVRRAALQTFAREWQRNFGGRVAAPRRSAIEYEPPRARIVGSVPDGEILHQSLPLRQTTRQPVTAAHAGGRR